MSRYDSRYPSLEDLRRRARARLPRFVWDYLDSATGAESGPRLNRAALDAVRLMPSILHGEVAPELGTQLLGQDYALPVGISPVGQSGLIWPGAERILAASARAERLPYTLSTVATMTPEDLSAEVAGDGWFQLYPPRDPEIRADMLARARKAGFRVLVLTADVPVASRRERQVRGGITTPPRLTPRILAQIARRPAWALASARCGLPDMPMVTGYAEGLAKGPLSSTAHVGYLLRTAPDMSYLTWLRDHWDGPLVVKGVLDPEDVPRLEGAGVDALWVSNHGGRQFDGAPSSWAMLPAIRAATRLPLIADGDISGGLDILRALALGADFTMLGRGWHYAVAALGQDGPAHLAHILRADLIANMGQLGLARPECARERRLP